MWSWWPGTRPASPPATLSATPSSTGTAPSKGGSGRIAAFINQAQGAAGEVAAELPGGGLAGLLVKLGIRALTNSPVTPLQKPPPYDTNTLGRAIQDLCRDHKVVVYVRKAYLDAADSLVFLYQTCGGRLDVMLGDRKQNLLVMFCVREQDVKKDSGGRSAKSPRSPADTLR